MVIPYRQLSESQHFATVPRVGVPTPLVAGLPTADLALMSPDDDTSRPVRTTVEAVQCLDGKADRHVRTVTIQ
jgi:hypothetical protein